MAKRNLKEEEIVQKLKDIKEARTRLARTMNNSIKQHESLMKILLKEDNEYVKEEARLVNELAKLK